MLTRKSMRRTPDYRCGRSFRANSVSDKRGNVAHAGGATLEEQLEQCCVYAQYAQWAERRGPEAAVMSAQLNRAPPKHHERGMTDIPHICILPHKC